MTTRTLPPSDWGRLAGTDLGSVIHRCDPSSTTVLVVEDGDEIVGCWAAFVVVHAEGVWIAPDHRGKTSVARRLWAGMQRIVRETFGASGVWTGAENGAVQALIEAHGGAALPPVWWLPMQKERS